ncbi:MAG: CopD family protein [Vicinamibacterales bacterium]
MGDSLTLESLPKIVAYMATLSYVGAVMAAALARSSSGAVLLPRAARVARVAAAAALVAVAARAWVHASIVADGWPDRETLTRVVLESRWGGRWQWQLAATVAALAVASLGAVARGVWIGPALVAVAWSLATPLLGHGAVTTWQQITHAAHVLVTGAWLGTVAVLALSTHGPGADLAAVGRVVARFSPIALTCAALAGVSGGVLAVTYVGTLADLIGSPYGRWLLLKLAAVAAVGGCGLVNWRRSRADIAPSPAWLRAEAVAAVLAAVVTAILTETEHPAL